MNGVYILPKKYTIIRECISFIIIHTHIRKTQQILACLPIRDAFITKLKYLSECACIESVLVTFLVVSLSNNSKYYINFILRAFFIKNVVTLLEKIQCFK